MTCLNQTYSFAAFDRKKLSRLAQFYPRDFSAIELSMFDDQLQNYIIDMRSEFVELKSIGDLAAKMVVTKREKVHKLVYWLLTLALLLPIATATVENIICYEYFEDSTVQSNGRSIVTPQQLR